MKPPGQQLIHLVLALAKAGDLETLPRLSAEDQLALALKLSALMQRFDFEKSIAFAAVTEGKSAAVVAAWRRRVSAPLMRSQLREQFYDQLRRMLNDGQVERYFQPVEANEIAEVRTALMALDQHSHRAMQTVGQAGKSAIDA